MRRTTLELAPAALIAVLVTVGGAAHAADDGCPVEPAAAPATAPDPGQDGGAPGNAGNTGWTGGTGGSHIGTSGQGAVAESKTWQPPTATGLDLAGTTASPTC